MSANTLLNARHIQSQKKVKLLTSSNSLTAEELVTTNVSGEGGMIVVHQKHLMNHFFY